MRKNGVETTDCGEGEKAEEMKENALRRCRDPGRGNSRGNEHENRAKQQKMHASRLGLTMEPKVWGNLRKHDTSIVQ